MAMHRRSTHEDQRHAERVISAEALSSMQLALGRPAPKNQFPEGTIDPDVAAAVIKDELMLDGNARLNLATFVTTWMEPQAEALMTECFDKNMIDKDEYPQTAELERRCVSMLADLWNAPGTEGVGCSTTGSSKPAGRSRTAPQVRHSTCKCAPSPSCRWYAVAPCPRWMCWTTPRADNASRVR